MPNYTTYAKLESLYEPLSDAGLSKAQQDFYINQAEAEINGRIAVRYSLPFSVTPALIETVTTELALQKILDRFFTSEARSSNDWREVRKRDLNKLLDGIAAGTVSLVDSDCALIAQRSESTLWSSTEDYIPVFSHLDATQEVVDEDLIDDEEDDRNL